MQQLLVLCCSYMLQAKQKHVQQIPLKARNFQWICDAHAFLYYSIIRLILSEAAALSDKMMCSSHLLQHFLRSHIGEQFPAV